MNYKKEGLIKVKEKINSEDIVGQTFGYWTVDSVSRKNKSGMYMYNCTCKCGTKREVWRYGLVNGYSKSCGCYGRERVHESKFIDLTGKVFGRLTVLGVAYKKNRQYFYHCICECGNETIVRGVALTKKYKPTRSCGCIRKGRKKGPEKVGKYDYIIGKKFGLLTPVEKLSGNVFKCKCDCGNEINATGYRLVGGRTKSCGCASRKKNVVD